MADKRVTKAEITAHMMQEAVVQANLTSAIASFAAAVYANDGELADRERARVHDLLDQILDLKSSKVGFYRRMIE